MIVIKTLKGRVMAVTNKYTLIYKKGYLYVYDNEENVIIAKKKIGNWIEKNTLISRLLRKEPRCAVKLGESSFLISYNGGVWNYDFKSNILFKEHSYGKGMKNPLSFCVETKSKGENNIYYGEYIWNENKGPVAIYRRDSSWKKIYEFDAGEITHIHSMVFDKKNQCFYILTGDEDSESGIWVANYDFTDVKPLVIGKQKFRSCVLFPTFNGLLFATDTPLENNSIFLLRKDNETIEIDKIVSLPGSCIFGGIINNEFYFATAVEPDSSLPELRYRVTYKLGKGIKDRYSHIFRVTNSGNIEEVYKEKKDILPMWLFQFGNFIFPYNETSDVIVVSQALKCGHSKTLYLGGDISG